MHLVALTAASVFAVALSGSMALAIGGDTPSTSQDVGATAASPSSQSSTAQPKSSTPAAGTMVPPSGGDVQSGTLNVRPAAGSVGVPASK